jgi:hypothetical protein
MEESNMSSRRLNVTKCFCLLATALVVAWGLYATQFRGFYGGFGEYWYDLTDEKYGWPVFFLTSSERYVIINDTRFVKEISREIAYRALAADVALWLAMMAAAVYIARRALWSGWRFKLSSLFAVTTAGAVMLAWWRIERAGWYVRGASELTSLWQAAAGKPLLRLLDFSRYVYVPVLFGAGCLVLCAILVASAAARFAVRAMRRKMRASSGAASLRSKSSGVDNLAS